VVEVNDLNDLIGSFNDQTWITGYANEMIIFQLIHTTSQYSIKPLVRLVDTKVSPAVSSASADGVPRNKTHSTHSRRRVEQVGSHLFLMLVTK
jgi:hypothetical protein